MEGMYGGHVWRAYVGRILEAYFFSNKGGIYKYINARMLLDAIGGYCYPMEVVTGTEGTLGVQ